MMNYVRVNKYKAVMIGTTVVNYVRVNKYKAVMIGTTVVKEKY